MLSSLTTWKGVQGQATATTAASTAQPSTGQSQASTSNDDPNSSDSNKQEQSKGAISGLSNLKRKLAEKDNEGELYKIEQTKMEDEISTVTNSLSKLGDQMINLRQEMMAFSGNTRAEFIEMKNILLGMNNKRQHLQDEKPNGVQKRVKRHRHHPTMRKLQQR
jgi:hypothetical protein